MSHYSAERKASVLRKLLPPHNRPVPEVAREEGICDQTLYNWRKQAKQQGVPVPGSGKQTEDWSPEAKFAAVVETASMTELELSEYCRRQGLYPEQLRRWKDACIQGAQRVEVQQQQQQRLEAKQDKQRIKALEKELKRKEKALAEAAALLVLRKKLTALWEENEAD